MNTLLYESHDFIGVLTLNRPQALNAFNSEMVDELLALFPDLAKEKLRCLIITGSGEKAFMAGADIAEMNALPYEKAVHYYCDASNAAMEAVEQFPAPVIAAVNGYALGGGNELALSCDIRLASENAVFAQPEVSLGIMPGSGGIQRLMRAVGPGKAKELLYTTRRLKAEEALAIGLVNAVYPREELMPAAVAMAEKIAANAPVGVAATKRIANASIGMTLEESYRLELEAFGGCFKTNDQKMAMTAFVEKRKPEPFTGN
ncbi:MAG: enoyl-CoA hydratase/isomerase family protein [Deltaproteobacteria bacterium]|nr:enoyl-CoA hydratase/isomerase family protein [Deltaproteobacteria bacterium]